MSRSRHPQRRRPVRLSISGDGQQGILQLRPGPPSASRTYLSAHEVLHGHPRLTDLDRQMLKAFLEGRPRMLAYTPNVRHRRPQLDRLVAQIRVQLSSAYRTRSSRTVIGLDAAGEKLFEIRPGSIKLYMGIDQEILQFSTAPWGTQREPRHRVEAPASFCTTHNMQLPASGICDFCM